MAAPFWKSILSRRPKSQPAHRRSGLGGMYTRLGLEAMERRELLSVAPLHWTPGPTLPAPQAQAAAIEDNGLIRLFGGIATGDTTAVVSLSSVATSWSTGYALDFGRLSPGVGQQPDGQLLVFGGRKISGAVVDEALHYDPYLGDSQDAATMNDTRFMMAAATDDSGHVYAIGGFDGAGSGAHVLATVEQYDLDTDQWNEVSPLPSGRAAFAAVADGEGHFFTFGGGTTTSSTSVSSTVFMYDVAADSWTTVAPMPLATRESAAVMGANGLIFVIGGRSASGVIDTIQVYDSAANSWSIDTVGHLPAPIRAASAASDSLGRLVVMGGYDAGGTAVSNVWYSQLLNQPDTLPVITSAAPSQLPQFRPVVGYEYTFQVVGTGNPLPDFSLDVAPAGMTIDGQSGLIRWTPVPGQDGPQNVTVRATNFAGATTQSFTLNVYATPPDLTAPNAPTGLNVSNITPTTATLNWTAATDNVAVASYNIYEVRTTVSRWARRTYYTQVATGVTDTTYALTNLKPNSYHRYVIKAVDTSGNLSVYSSLMALTTTSPPTLTYYSYYGGTPSVTADHLLSMSLYMTGNPTPTVALVSGPAGMSVTPAGLVTWTPSGADVGNVPAVFRATNSVGTADLNLTITVRPNLPVLSANPIFDGTRYVAPFAIADQPFTLQLAEHATGGPVVYSIDSGPTGMTVDAATGAVSWLPAATDVGTLSIVFRATNYAGSTTLTVSLPVYAAGTDKTPPSAVTGITLTNVAAGTATVNWIAATDDVGVAGYNITVRYGYAGRGHRYRYLHFTAAGDATSFVLTGLPSTYKIYITAFDAAGNVGAVGV